MAVRNKTRRRLWLLLCGICSLAILGVVGYQLRQHQVNARVLRGRNEGFAAFEAGDYFAALNKIGPFVQRNPRDVAADLKYAIARENVEEPDGKNLGDAMVMYKWILEIQPDQAEARQHLLELDLASGGYGYTEILAVTKDRSDPVSVRARALALGSLGRTSEAETSADTYNKLKPLDLRMQMFRLSLKMRDGATTPDQLVAQTSDLLKAHPDDPHFQLLMGMADQLAKKDEEARDLTLKATQTATDDPDFVQIAVQQLDGFRMHDEALKLLEKAAKVHGDISFERMVLARLYQAGQYAEVVARTNELQGNPAKADIDLLARRAMALAELNRPDESRKVIDALAARKTEFAAVGWADVLSIAPHGLDIPDEKKIINTCREAIKSRPDTAYVRLMLGDSYARLGELDAALRQWIKARDLAPIWPRPWARILRMLLAAGRMDDARQCLDTLQPLATNDAESLAIVAQAKSQLSPSADQASLSALIQDADRVQSLQPGEPGTLGLKVHLLCKLDRRDQAADLIRQWLAADHSSAPALLELAQASHSEKLDLENTCFERCRALHGMSIQLALAQIISASPGQMNRDTLKQLDELRAAAADRGSAAWDISRLRLQDLLADPDAAKNWTTLADSNPDNLAVQYAVTTSKSTQSDLQLQHRAIDRLGSVIGEDGSVWRLAEARLTMQSAAKQSVPAEREKELAEAASILNALTLSYPDLPAAQMMLGDCLLDLNRRQEAADSFAKAARLVPESVDLSLRLASLLQSMGDFQRAKPYLDQAEAALQKSSSATTAPAQTPPAAGGSVDVAAATRMNLGVLATLLAADGQTDRAAAIFRKLDRDNSAIDLNLAAIFGRRGELTEQTCKQLLAQATPSSIEIAAEYYAATGRSAEAESTIAMLDTLDAPRAKRELTYGIYLFNTGSTKDAIGHLRAACSADRSDRAAWQYLIASLLRDGQGHAALVAAADAQQALPNEAYLAQLIQHADLLNSLSSSTANPARALLAFVPTAPGQADAIFAAAQVIHGGLESKRTITQVAAELRPIADQVKSFWPLQQLLVDLYARSGDLDNATALASRSMSLSPSDPAPAQRMTELLLSAGRWDQIVPVALDWRQRLGSQTRPADEILVTAYFATGNPAAAIALLQPYRESGGQDPSATLIADAQNLLKPALQTSSLLRRVWMSLAAAAMPDARQSREWLQLITASVPADAIDERITLASRWDALAKRTKDPSDQQAANQALQSVNDLIHSTPQATATQWLALASLKENAQDVAGAESDYRACLKLDKNQVVAQNNLAMILQRRGGDMSEAQALAKDAASDPAHPAHADFLDTLGLVQSQARDFKEAEASIRNAILLRPQDPSMRIDLIRVLISAGKIAEARQALAELDQLMAILAKPDLNLPPKIEELRKQLQNLPNDN